VEAGTSVCSASGSRGGPRAPAETLASVYFGDAIDEAADKAATLRS